MQDFVRLEVLESHGQTRVRLRKTRKPRQQQPLDQTLARTDNEFHRLPRARASEFLQRAERVPDNFIKSLADVCEFCRTMTAFEQLDPEVALQFLELATELALPVRVVAGRRGNSARGDNLAKRLQPFQRET